MNEFAERLGAVMGRISQVAADPTRIDEYERALTRHATEVVRVSTAPCGDTTHVVPGYYLCQKVAP